MAEYNTLRSEILQRIGFRFQLINLILIVAGTFLTAGVQPDIPASVLLVYPLLSLFLTASWVHNGIVLAQIGRYIKDHIESKITGLQWQSSGSKYFFRGWGTLATSGLVLTTQLLALALAFIKGNFTTIERVLFICSSVAIVLTLILLRYSTGLWRRA
jgi:hypothetical protein